MMPKIPDSSVQVEEQVEQQPEEREVIYPAVFAVAYQRQDRPRRKGTSYEPPMDIDTVKELLGWQEEPLGSSEEAATGFFGDDYLFKDMNGRKVRCLNNPGNRPYDHKWSLELAHTHLRRKWQYNGESMVIGKTGRTLSCQHRLIGAVLAEQMRTGPNAGRWEQYWGEESITIECVVVYGVEEDAALTSTHDNVKPRSLSDVLYADVGLFGGLKASDRRGLANVVSQAVRFFRYRTGAVPASKDRELSFFPRRTHGLYIDLLAKHGRLKQASKHVYEENRGSEPPLNILGFKSKSGEAAALLYMMGCSATDPEQYTTAMRLGEEGEHLLDWSMWDQAKQFWSLLCDTTSTKPPALQMAVRYACLALMSTEGEGGGTADEHRGIICKAWQVFSQGHGVHKNDLKLEYQTVDGVRYLAETPDVGGIDCGGVNDEDPHGSPVASESAPAAEQDDQATVDDTPVYDPDGEYSDESEQGDVTLADLMVDDAPEMPEDELERRKAEVRAESEAQRDADAARAKNAREARKKARAAGTANGQQTPAATGRQPRKKAK